VVVIALVAVLGWKYSSRRPEAVALGEQASVIDMSREPEQVDTAHKVLNTNADKVSVSSLTTYRIWAKAICVRAYAGYDRGSSGFPIDLGLAWGDVGKSDYKKYVSMHFSNDEATNQWLMFQFKTEDSPWTTAYFESHVSNNHICPASANIYNAIMSLKTDDSVYLEGFLAESFGRQGDTRLVSSLSRTDTAGGACECFYVTKAQIGDMVYK
jgi:REP element-mobilizing transposase RayT